MSRHRQRSRAPGHGTSVRGVIQCTLGRSHARLGVLCGLTLLVAGCAGQGAAEAGPAGRAALTFQAAVEDDPAAACTLLAPGTLEELEETDGPCATAIADAGLPSGPGAAEDVEVYGKDALVRAGSDTLFLARFDDGWRVTAAGCTAVPDQPYDCVLEAG